MKSESAATEKQDFHSSLEEQLRRISENCTGCGLCRKECAFLKRWGKPKDIADSYDPGLPEFQTFAFECSLCSLCTAVCPEELDLKELFLEMRRESVRRNAGDFPEHSVIRNFERRGTSKRYTWYGLPAGCDTVFFPGCSLSGTRPERVKRLYDYLRKEIPGLGIVLDCCTKPSHDLGDEATFRLYFGEMKRYLLDQGVGLVIVACPNCYKVFKRYGDALTVSTVYELLSRTGTPHTGTTEGIMTMHDPCSIRFEKHIHEAVRFLAAAKGVRVEEMRHNGTRTVCCGEGGSVGFLSPELSQKWGDLRKKEVDGRRVLTYCAGCANYLGASMPASHILDLVLEPGATMNGAVRVSRPPFTYLNRLRLKRHFMKAVDAHISRERPWLRKGSGAGGLVKRLVLFACLAGAVISVRLTDAAEYLDPERLRQVVEGYGAMAPIIYMLFYSASPALFLPGLPLTVAAGILFGPFWGVVYAITGATIGATAAFVVARYVGRDWIRRKLRSPRWRRLDKEVERHGWKVVAFTRLIPLFPFNLLNYGFGLTGIGLLQYIVPTFICMLPACIAYIVFSSSLLDVLKGNVSPAFMIGLVLIAVVSMAPRVYRRFRSDAHIGGL